MDSSCSSSIRIHRLIEADRSTVWPMFITAQVMLAITRVVEILLTSV
ncbi:hypothetical protein [Synechococcus sp. MIT S9503]